MDRFEELLERLGFLSVELPGTATGAAEAAIYFLLEHLVLAGRLRGEHAEEAAQRVLAREQLGSTAIGEGIALPHATTSAVERIVGIAARSATGVTWRSRDGLPVLRVCLILAPPDRPGDYLRVLESLSLCLRPRTR